MMERVEEDDLARWKEEKAASVMADSRVLPLRRNAHRVRHRTEPDAIQAWSPDKPSDFPLRGPPAVKEWFGSLDAAGQTVLQHHMDFVRKSGLPEKSSVAREHAALSESLRYFVTWDQVDCCGLVGIEMMIRRLITIEMAVARNPRCPDWEGLDVVIASRIGESGQAAVQDFETWLSSTQRDQAVVLKQGRLLREERAAQDRRAGGGASGSGEGGGGNRGRGRGREGRGRDGRGGGRGRAGRGADQAPADG